MPRAQSSHHHTVASCRFCGAGTQPDHEPHFAGICRRCLYKAGIIILIIMVSISAIVWVGIL
ncbi:MAG: hypothetical protein MUC66_05860 [Methanolinea sp.]|jgi:hypothetical protein|nr:hypothetical protein [Methanolinea sp.]